LAFITLSTANHVRRNSRNYEPLRRSPRGYLKCTNFRELKTFAFRETDQLYSIKLKSNGLKMNENFTSKRKLAKIS